MITRVLIVLVLLWTLPAQAKSEADYVAEWCGLHGLAYEGPTLTFKTPSGRNVYADCISDNVVVEADRARKYKEGIGQAITYGVLSGRRHVILLLIIEKQSDCDYYYGKVFNGFSYRKSATFVVGGES